MTVSRETKIARLRAIFPVWDESDAVRFLDKLEAPEQLPPPTSHGYFYVIVNANGGWEEIFEWYDYTKAVTAVRAANVGRASQDQYRLFEYSGVRKDGIKL